MNWHLPAEIVFVSLLVISCNINNPELVTFDTGTIRLADVKQTVTHFKETEESPIQNINHLKEVITSEFIIPRLKSAEGQLLYGNQKRIKLQKQHMKIAATNHIFKEMKLEKYNPTIPLYRIRRLEFAYRSETQQSRRTQAQTILALINADRSRFTEMIKKHAPTEEQSANDGMLEYRSIDLLPSSVAQVVSQMKSGELYHDLVETDSTWLIIELVDIKKITFQTLRSLEKPSLIASRILDIETGKCIDQLIENLQKQHIVTKNFQALNSSDKTAVIISVGAHYNIDYPFYSYRFGYNIIPASLRRDYSYYPTIPNSITLQEQIIYCNSILLPEGLLYSQALSEKTDHSNACIDFIEQELLFFYAGVMDYYLQQSGDQPTPDQLLQYYNNNIDHYVDGEHLFNTQQKRYLPFEVVRERIITAITSKSNNDRYQTWQRQTLDKYHVIWNEKALENVVK